MRTSIALAVALSAICSLSTACKSPERSRIDPEDARTETSDKLAKTSKAVALYHYVEVYSPDESLSELRERAPEDALFSPQLAEPVGCWTAASGFTRALDACEAISSPGLELIAGNSERFTMGEAAVSFDSYNEPVRGFALNKKLEPGYGAHLLLGSNGPTPPLITCRAVEQDGEEVFGEVILAEEAPRWFSKLGAFENAAGCERVLATGETLAALSQQAGNRIRFSDAHTVLDVDGDGAEERVGGISFEAGEQCDVWMLVARGAEPESVRLLAVNIEDQWDPTPGSVGYGPLHGIEEGECFDIDGDRRPEFTVQIGFETDGGHELVELSPDGVLQRLLTVAVHGD